MGTDASKVVTQRGKIEDYTKAELSFTLCKTVTLRAVLKQLHKNDSDTATGWGRADSRLETLPNHRPVPACHGVKVWCGQ